MLVKCCNQWIRSKNNILSCMGCCRCGGSLDFFVFGLGSVCAYFHEKRCEIILGFACHICKTGSRRGTTLHPFRSERRHFS
uniref:Uncharacterized protein n=1 Tax=Anguilla anguilla TaxID=7936 RepID=A0A0E9SGF1_ANGAN